jgi:hypothetical protein
MMRLKTRYKTLLMMIVLYQKYLNIKILFKLLILNLQLEINLFLLVKELLLKIYLKYKKIQVFKIHFRQEKFFNKNKLFDKVGNFQ